MPRAVGAAGVREIGTDMQDGADHTVGVNAFWMILQPISAV